MTDRGGALRTFARRLVAVAVIGGAVGLFKGTVWPPIRDSLCEDVVLSEAASPDGVYIAQQMERRCPTLEALRIVRIRSESEILEPSMEVEGDERHDWALALTTSAPIDMAWPEGRTLSLKAADFSGMKLFRSQLGKIRIVPAQEPPPRH